MLRFPLICLNLFHTKVTQKLVITLTVIHASTSRLHPPDVSIHRGDPVVRRSVGLPRPDLCPLAAVRHGGPAHLPHLLLLRLWSQVCLRNAQLLLRYEPKLILVGKSNKAWSMRPTDVHSVCVKVKLLISSSCEERMRLWVEAVETSVGVRVGERGW